MLLLNHGGSVVGTAAGGLVERVRIFFFVPVGNTQRRKVAVACVFLKKNDAVH